MLATLTLAWPLAAQPPPDTTPPPPQDTTAQQPQDTGAAAQPDTTEVRVFPRFTVADSVSPLMARRWEHEDLLGRGALDAGELLEFEPELVPIRAGFFEGPQAHLFAGAGGTSVRWLVDGYELVPLGTVGYLDTHLISIAEYDRVDLLRGPGGYRLEADLFRRQRREAYSRVNGGTGDRDTNLIGGIFAARLFGAPMAFGFDRVDSRGSVELGSMERNSIWTQLSYPLPADVWGQIEFRRTVADRDSLIGTDRTDVILRFRRRLGPSWTADVIAGRASVTETPGGTAQLPDSLVEKASFSARQLAVRAGGRGPVWSATFSLRAFDGDGVPDWLNEATLGAKLGPLRVSGTGRHERWSDLTLYSGYGRAGLRLPYGLRLAAEVEDGGRGLVGSSPAIRRQFFTRVSGEIGFRQGLWDLRLKSGRWRVDPSPGLGVPFDSAVSLPGGTVGVLEARGTVPLFRLFGGQLTAGGHYQIREAGAVLYWPKDRWFLEGRYYKRALQDQLEIDLTARGGVRGPMLVTDPALDPALVSSSADLVWFRAEMVIRVKDVRIFWNIEGFDAAEESFDVPGFNFPTSRSHFGLRWEFWN